MSQDRALKIPDREKPASRIPCETERKRLNQEKMKTRQSWAGKGAETRSKKETLGRKKGGTDSSGRTGAVPGNMEFQTCSCTLHTSFSFRCLRWLGLVLLM